jgi:hypothetical protein
LRLGVARDRGRAYGGEKADPGDAGKGDSGREPAQEPQPPLASFRAAALWFPVVHVMRMSNAAGTILGVS